MTAIRRFDGKRLTIRRVTETAVVSASSVSHVLTGKATVYVDLRAAVSEAVEGGDKAMVLIAGPLI